MPGFILASPFPLVGLIPLIAAEVVPTDEIDHFIDSLVPGRLSVNFLSAILTDMFRPTTPRTTE